MLYRVFAFCKITSEIIKLALEFHDIFSHKVLKRREVNKKFSYQQFLSNS